MFWSEFIDHKRRPNFLAILEALSRRQDKHTPDFVIIGALALLMQNYLHYPAWWDVDLLFRDEATLRKFAENMTAPGLRIEPMDDTVVSTGDLACLHTMWSFGRTWANVDYIYRPERFQFFFDTPRNQKPFAQKIRLYDREYHINLLLANPWDIFLDKLVLSRFIEQFNVNDFSGKDLRHLLLILQQDHTRQDFWQYLIVKSESLGRREMLKTVLLRLVAIAPELGYKDVCDAEKIVQYIDKLM